MKPESLKDPDQEGGHNHKRPIGNRVSLSVIVRCMRHPLDEVGVGPQVTLPASFQEALLGDCGFRIFGRQNTVKSVTIGTACDKGRITQFFNLPVVAPIVGLGCNEEDPVSLHHLPVPVAFLADLGMEFFPKCECFGTVSLQEGNFMEAMAITAGRRVMVAGKDGLAMEALQITVIGVAGRTFLNHPGLVPLPGGHLVDLYVAVLALNVIDEMGARIVL